MIRFSALQRAENSSMVRLAVPVWCLPGFQCSSASRKFLNRRFLALPQLSRDPVSVLFSEPKIPQYISSATLEYLALSFSALQRAENSSIVNFGRDGRLLYRFQCSSASRKFLNGDAAQREPLARHRFSALQRAENSSIVRGAHE